MAESTVLKAHYARIDQMGEGTRVKNSLLEYLVCTENRIISSCYIILFLIKLLLNTSWQ